MTHPRTTRRLVLLACLITGLASAATARSTVGYPAAPAAEHTVRLIVDYGDGVQKHFTALPWKKDLTVLDALNAAKASSHGISFQHSGSGATTFISKIDDLSNEGGGKRNWIFWVNTSLGDKSCGVYKLEPSDVVLWKFSVQQKR